MSKGGNGGGGLATSLKDPIGSDAIRDPWVLIFVGVSWMVVVISWLREKNYDFKLNSAGILVQVERPSKNDKKRLPKKGVESGEQELPKSKSKSKSKLKSSFLHRPETGQLRVRTYATFRTGEEPPPKPRVTFQEEYSSSRRWLIYRTLLHSALMRCWRFVVVCGLIATTLSWWVKTCQPFAEKFGTTWIDYETVYGNLQAASAIHSQMMPLASFVLALYINQKLAWFNSVITQAWTIQGRMSDLALILGSVGADDQVVWAAKYRVYRYLSLAHFFLYQAVSEHPDSYDDLSEVSFETLLSAGLIAPDELRFLQRSREHGLPRSTALLWVGMTFQELADAGKIQQSMLPRVFDALRELRGAIDTLAKELTRVTPISFVQLLQLMVDVLMLLTPPSLAYSLETKRDGVTVYLWPAFGSMVMSLFWQGGMKLICSMEHPFGTDLDDLRLDWLLSSTERAVYGYLTQSRPPPLAVEVERCRVSKFGMTTSEPGGHDVGQETTLYTEDCDCSLSLIGRGKTINEKLSSILPGAVSEASYPPSPPSKLVT